MYLVQSYTLWSLSLPPLSADGSAVVLSLGCWEGGGADLGAVGNGAVTALGSLSSPGCDSSPGMCQERVRKE